MFRWFRGLFLPFQWYVRLLGLRAFFVGDRAEGLWLVQHALVLLP